MPRQGQSVEACTIVRWLKQPGDSVAAGELLCEIETDKASFEVESTAEGTLLVHFAGEGEEVPVLTAIAAVGEPGEEPPVPDGSAAAASATAQVETMAALVPDPDTPRRVRQRDTGCGPPAEARPLRRAPGAARTSWAWTIPR